MIDRIIHQVWIGPLPPPKKWMKTWQKKNPNWEYIFWDNEKVFGRKWKNQRLIDYYVGLYEKNIKDKSKDGKDKFTKLNGVVLEGDAATYYAWHILSDIIRYEILYEYGGYMPGADTICLRSIDDKFSDDIELYTVRTGALYENKYQELLAEYKEKNIDVDKLDRNSREYKNLQRMRPENMSPILGAQKGDVFLKHAIDELSKLKISDLGEAVDTTGNVFMGKLVRKYNPKNLTAPDYIWNKDRINGYSRNCYGTTKNSYHLGR